MIQDDVERGRLNCVVGVVPVPAEFIDDCGDELIPSKQRLRAQEISNGGRL